MSNTFTVTNANDSGAGSLRQAILDANAQAGADIIRFDDSLTGETITLNSGELLITDDVTVDGDTDDDGTADITVDANKTSRVFKVDDDSEGSDKTVILEGLTITGGRDDSGGGVFNTENLTVVNSTISGNIAAGTVENPYLYFYSGGFGGGVAAEGGSLTITSSDIVENSAVGLGQGRDGQGSYPGGGGIVSNNSLVTIVDSNINRNVVSGAVAEGGGIASNGGSVTITNSNVVRNSALDSSGRGTGRAGGIANNGSRMTITDSNIIENRAMGENSAQGGGIASDGGHLAITGSAITDNTASAADFYFSSSSSSLGGGVYLSSRFSDDIKTILTNVTLSGNKANSGGGLFNDGHATIIKNSTLTENKADVGSGIASRTNSYASTEIRSSIVSGNLELIDDGDAATTNDIAGSVISGGNNLIGSGSAIGNFSEPTDIISTDPKLVPLQGNGGFTKTFALQPGSPAINAGANPDGLATDQRGSGFARDVGQTDIGAFELQDNPLVGPTITSENTATVNENETDAITITAEDDQPGIQFSLSGGNDVDLFNINATSGHVTFKTAPDFESVFETGGSNIYNIRVTATDADGLSVTEPIAITVRNVNEDPFATDDSLTTSEDDTLSGSLLTDNGNGLDFDQDGDTLTVARINNSAASVGTTVQLGSGQLTVNADGTFTFDPSGGYEALSVGQSAQESFTYTIDDGNGNTGSATATINIIGRNEPITFIVTNTNDSGAGSLRQAILDANARVGADIIRFDDGLTNETIAIDSGELLITDDVTVDGDTDNDGTPDITVDATNTSRVFKVDDDSEGLDKTVILKGLTITGGRAGSGGGVLNSENLTVVSSTISGNTALETFVPYYYLTDGGYGGGITTVDGSLTITNSNIVENVVLGDSNGLISFPSGGGISSISSRVTITNSNIVGNAALGKSDGSSGSGGGISSNFSSRVTITNSNIVENVASGPSPYSRGGGIASQSGYLTITNSTINDNSTDDLSGSSGGLGGGIYRTAGGPRYNGEITTTLTNVTLSGNTARSGGGLFNDQGRILISNSTISENGAEQGSGIASPGDPFAAPIEVSSSIISGNLNLIGKESNDVEIASSNPETTNNFTSGGNNFVGGGNAIGSFSRSTDIIGIDPKLGPLQSNGGFTKTFALQPGSPAINAGANPDDLATDQRGSGFARSVDQTDIGAFEVQDEPIVIPTVKGQLATIFVDATTNRVIGDALQAGELYDGSLSNNTDGTPTPDDTILGTSDSDNLYGGIEGSDTIAGLEGDDIIGYGSGDAHVEAGSGNDLVYAAVGSSDSNNEISLGAGSDNFYATGGNNLITGTDNNTIGLGSGNDTVTTDSGDDFVYTVNGGGDNVLALGEGRNNVWVERGNYNIATGAGDDLVGLGSGTDIVNAGNGNNLVYMVDTASTAGSKDILTGTGDDYIQSGSGDDLIDGGSGFNTLFGGSGADTFTLRQDAYNFIGDFELGVDKIDLEGLGANLLTFYQGTGEVAQDAFVFVGLLAIAQIANTQIEDLGNANNFI